MSPLSTDPVVQWQRLLVYTQKTMVRVHPGSLRFHALIRQLVERLDLRSSGCEFESHSGQLYGHGLVGNWQIALLRTQRCRPIQPSMADRCPVRIPLELFINTSSRSSSECSPPCQGGDQGFKSPRGRFSHDDTNSIASAGHWRAQVAVTHPPSGFGGSTPSRRTYFQFLSSRVGQCPSGPHKP